MKVFVFVLAAMFLAAPLAVSADQISDLQNEVKVLTQVLRDLQAKRAAGGASCAAMATMGPGSSGLGVTELQQLLARDSALYPEGKITGYYGPLTMAAVKRFQAKSGIVSSGSPSSTGYGRVGPKTLAAIQAQCGQGGGSGIASLVSGFIQVSPDQGSAPLQVTVEANVNTTNDCGAALYTLDFGDNSPKQLINVPAGFCKTAQQSYMHTYSAAGVYPVTLASGEHFSTATVVVQ